MRSINILWVLGMMTAPVGGWFAAKYHDTGQPVEYTAARQTGAPEQPPPANEPNEKSLQVPATPPAAPSTTPEQELDALVEGLAGAPAATTDGDGATAPDELSRTKATLTKLVTALKATDADGALANLAKLETRIADDAAARENVRLELGKVGVNNVGEAISLITDLNQRMVQQCRIADQSQKLASELEMLRVSQGWQSASRPPTSTLTTNQVPVATVPTVVENVVCYQ